MAEAAEKEPGEYQPQHNATNHQNRSDRHRVIKVMHAGARLRQGPEPLAQVLVARRVAGVDAGGCAALPLEDGRPDVVAAAYDGRGRRIPRREYDVGGILCQIERKNVMTGKSMEQR